VAKLKFLKGMQIYFSVPWSRKALTLRPGPPWIDNVANLSLPQLKAALALAEAAHTRAYGQFGKRRYKGMMMPASAVIVATTVPKGPGIHGGKTIEERRRERHEAAAASIEALRSLITVKSAIRGVPAQGGLAG
jgi:hypothetical protein